MSSIKQLICCTYQEQIIQLIIDDHLMKRHYVNITCKATIEQVKSQIPVDLLKSQLFIGKTKLENDKTLESYGIIKNTKLYLIYGANIKA